MFQQMLDARYGSFYAELVKFTRGNSEYRYTTSEQSVTFNGQVYRPDYSIKVGAYSVEGSVGTVKNLELTVSQNHPISLMYRTFFPAEKVRVQIYVGFANDPEMEFLPFWNGYVASANFTENSETKDKTARIICAHRLTSLDQKGVPYRFGRTCQHVVYRGGCGLPKEPNSYSATVASIDRANILFSSLPLGGTEYVAGVAELANGEYRDILAQDGNLITVNYAFDSLSVGDQVTLSRGCNRTEERCIELGNTDNLLRFRISKRNIFGTGEL